MYIGPGVAKVGDVITIRHDRTHMPGGTIESFAATVKTLSRSAARFQADSDATDAAGKPVHSWLFDNSEGGKARGMETVTWCWPMTRQALFAALELRDIEFGRFDLVERKLATRPLLHAMVLLDSLIPQSDRNGIFDYVSIDGSEASFNPDFVAKYATPEVVAELNRCGMFVVGHGIYIEVGDD